MGATNAEEMRTLHLGGVDLELSEQGSGPPLLFLHPGHPLGRMEASDPALRALSQSFRVILATHPGFGRREAPEWMNAVDDLAYLYLDLFEALDLRNVTLVGASLGGWIAAEIAIRNTSRLARLVLANPVGAKFGDRETRDFADIYAIFDKEIAELCYADPELGTPDIASLSEDTLFYMARSREATARYAWSPYLHSPKLKHRLHRIDVPALVICGEADRLTRAGYGKAFAEAIPNAKFLGLKGAGHFPHKEKPEEFARAVQSFVMGREKELVL